MQKHNYRKILSALIASLLILSALPLTISPVAAQPTATLSPDTGPVGKTVTVTGTGATKLGRIRAYWDGLEAADELVTEPAVVKATAAQTFEFNITIPEDYWGTHYVIVKDMTTNDVTDPLEFNITSAITLDPSTGLKNDVITVEGTGFGSELEVALTFNDTQLTTTPTTVETSTVGSFSCTFKVPIAVYGSCTVNATDEDGHWNSTAFKVGATITLSPPEGPSGTVVAITGRGFRASTGTEVTIEVDGVTASQIAAIKTKSDRTFTGQFVIPGNGSMPSADDYTVTATAVDSGTETFTLTGNSSISLSPSSAAPRTAVTIEGANFTAKAGVEVTVKFDTIEVGTLTTNSTGGFKGSITTPAPVKTFLVNASDEYGVWATVSFISAITVLAASEDEGPVGTCVTLTAFGLEGDYANVTFGDIQVLRDEPVADLKAGLSEFVVPTVPKGTYIMLVEDDEGLSAQTDFKVTATTTLTLDTPKAPVGYNVTISGLGFKHDSSVSLEIYNLTEAGEFFDSWPMENASDGSTTIYTNDDGEIPEFPWKVPSNFVLGSFYINATDDYAGYPDDEHLIYVTMIPFEVVEATLTAYTGASQYMRGQVARFYAKASFETTIAFEITDPDDFVSTIDVRTSAKIGAIYLGTAVMDVPNDAPLGTWTWIAWDKVADNKEDVNVTGSFKVVEEITAGTIEERVKTLEDTVKTLSDLVKDLSTSTTADIGALSTAVATLSAAVDTLKNEVAGVKTGVTDVKSAATAAETAAKAADVAAAAAQAAISGLSTTVTGLATSVSDAKTAAADAKSAATAAQSAATDAKTAADGAKSAVSALTTDVTDAKTAASAAQTSASDAKSAAQGAQSAVAGLTTIVYGVLIIALIAAIAGILATVQIQRKVVG